MGGQGTHTGIPHARLSRNTFIVKDKVLVLAQETRDWKGTQRAGSYPEQVSVDPPNQGEKSKGHSNPNQVPGLEVLQERTPERIRLITIFCYHNP